MLLSMLLGRKDCWRQREHIALADDVEHATCKNTWSLRSDREVVHHKFSGLSRQI